MSKVVCLRVSCSCTHCKLAITLLSDTLELTMQKSTLVHHVLHIYQIYFCGVVFLLLNRKCLADVSGHFSIVLLV